MPPVLPLVAAARVRNELARAKLRSRIPRTMAALEHGRSWEKRQAAEKLRDSVFGDGADKP